MTKIQQILDRPWDFVVHDGSVTRRSTGMRFLAVSESVEKQILAAQFKELAAELIQFADQNPSLAGYAEGNAKNCMRLAQQC